VVVPIVVVVVDAPVVVADTASAARQYDAYCMRRTQHNYNTYQTFHIIAIDDASEAFDGWLILVLHTCTGWAKK